jgi:hypothetical protein
MTKKRAITSLEKLSPELLKKLYELYPGGWSDSIKRINKPNGEFFHGISLETEETIYMVKVPVKVDSKSDLEKEERKMDGDYDDSSDDSGDSDDYVEPSEDPRED